MYDLKELKQFVTEFGTEFFALINDDFERATIPANQMIKDGFCYGPCFFGWSDDQLDLLCEGIGHGQNVFLVPDGCLQRSKEVGVDLLLRFGALGSCESRCSMFGSFRRRTWHLWHCWMCCWMSASIPGQK